MRSDIADNINKEIELEHIFEDMKEFEKLPPKVKAVQIKQNLLNVGLMQLLIKIANRAKQEFSVTEETFGYYIMLDGVQYYPHDDWIVIDNDGKISIIDNDDFREKFKPISNW